MIVSAQLGGHDDIQRALRRSRTMTIILTCPDAKRARVLTSA
jgi:hypothetical protein